MLSVLRIDAMALILYLVLRNVVDRKSIKSGIIANEILSIY